MSEIPALNQVDAHSHNSTQLITQPNINSTEQSNQHPNTYTTMYPNKQRWVERYSLSTQLLAISGVLLCIAMIVVGALTITLLRSNLLSQLDEELTNAGSSLAQTVLDKVQNPAEANNANSVLPSEYYITFDKVDGNRLVFRDFRQEQLLGTPQIKQLSPSEISKFHGASTPTTIAGSKKGVNWRVIKFSVRSQPLGVNVAVASIALPLSHVNTTTESAIEQTVFVSLGAILISLAVSWICVKRALRPLRKMRDTAKAITAGDLTQRVEPGMPHTEVGALAHSFNRMLGHLEESFKLREKSRARMAQFASDASHELRTPLATVRGYAELYRLGGVPAEEVGEAMSRIESEARRMSLLVDDLLKLARLNEERKLEKTLVNFAAIANDALSDFHARAPHRQTQLLAELTPNNLTEIDGNCQEFLALADPNLVTQVLANLLTNVLQHTPEETPTEIVLRKRGKNVVVQVRDHGPGIPPQAYEQVFARFYRLDKSRSRSSGGSGLGLPIVQQALHAHDGTAHALPTEGGGITIELVFPGNSRNTSNTSNMLNI